MTKLIVTFCNFAKASKNWTPSIRTAKKLEDVE
jgi:hypothetical protein